MGPHCIIRFHCAGSLAAGCHCFFGAGGQLACGIEMHNADPSRLEFWELLALPLVDLSILPVVITYPLRKLLKKKMCWYYEFC